MYILVTAITFLLVYENYYDKYSINKPKLCNTFSFHRYIFAKPFNCMCAPARKTSWVCTVCNIHVAPHCWWVGSK